MFTKLLSIPKTVWFNLRFLPLRQALRMPVAIHYKTCIKVRKGNIILTSPQLHHFMIRIGFHTVPIIHNEYTRMEVCGTLVFGGTAHIGRGSRIVINNGALVELGDNFSISASSSIYCHKHIKTGSDIQLSWNVLLMDSDTHTILDEDGQILNKDSEIILGNKIWVGCDCKILKGSYIPDNCVVGANSVVTSSSLTPNSLILGTPAKSTKAIHGFKI